jgi:hypothetical protein
MSFVRINDLSEWTHNLDHSIYKTVAIDLSVYVPQSTNALSYASIYYASTNLFDTDSGLEFLLTFQLDTIGADYPVNYLGVGTVIIEESGVATNYFGGGIVKYPYGYEFSGIVNTSGGTKMMVYYSFGNESSPGAVSVYSLPGTLATEPNGFSYLLYHGDIQLSNASNSAHNFTIVNYTLPEEVELAVLHIFDTNGHEIKTYEIDQAFDHLRVSTAELATGT